LVAELTDGKRIYGEEAIDLPRGTQRERIKDVFLVPHHHASISVYPPVLDAIRDADYIFIGPGDLFTSIIPNLIVPRVKEALKSTCAKIRFCSHRRDRSILGETWIAFKRCFGNKCNNYQA
jgi:uncharacterized cofD-like protein